MSIGNKIRYFRSLRGFSQENMAELLGMSVRGYAKIERDITNVSISRLKQIAEKLETNLPDLLGFDEKNFAYINGGNQSGTIYAHGNQYIETNKELSFEIEKLKLINDKVQLENESLKKEVAYLQNIIELIKNKKNNQ
jgi:transcriptional regulator with XRE-family HTH domain